MRLSGRRESKEVPVVLTSTSTAAAAYPSTGLSHRKQRGSGCGGATTMDPVGPTPDTGDSKQDAGVGLQALVHRSNASGQAEGAAAPPARGASKSAEEPVAATAAEVEESKGCWSCLCRCFYPKPASVSSQITVSPMRGLLPAQSPTHRGKKCLVLDLDETLVHSSFKPIPRPDYVIPVEIDGVVHYVYVRKRPGCDLFLRAVAEHYEVVVFTASLAKYADPLLDKLDVDRVISHRLFREACVFHEGSYVKDLRLLGRPIESVILVDNSPVSYLFQPNNALPCESFIEDPRDTELLNMVAYLESIAGVPDVRAVLHQWVSPGPGTTLGPCPTSGLGQGSNPYEANKS